MYDSAAAARFIGDHLRFLVVGHKEPDGDCIASQIALGELLSALGKTATLCSAGPFDRPEIQPYANRFSPTVPKAPQAVDAVIIADCSTPDRTGALAPALEGFPTLVIDHHSSGEAFGQARYVDSSAPSTTMLVFQLFEDIRLAPSAETAKLLLFGLCTDTGFFRHLGKNGVETFAAASRLTQLGTSTSEVYMMVYGMRELASRTLLAEMLVRVESRWADRLLLTWQTIADRQRLGVTQRGDDDLYRLLQTIKGNVVVALIKEERPGAFSVGLRSNTAVDVGAVAASFGGGGHRQASGFDIDGTLDSVRATLVQTFAPLLSQS
jgi:bifunctional oligoribonuclease and PAP phosphatase NrnA